MQSTLDLSADMLAYLKELRSRDKLGEYHTFVTLQEAIVLFEFYCEKTEPGRAMIEAAKNELRGFNLACTCKLNEPCHVDYLLRRVNE